MCENYSNCDTSFDSGISLDAFENERRLLRDYKRILYILERDKDLRELQREKLSKVTDRRPKKKNADRCNVCFEELDLEDFKSCATCCNCGKSVCRGRQCSIWLPNQAGWECQLCNLSNESRSRASEWVHRQTVDQYLRPMSAREINRGSRLSVYETQSEAPTSVCPEQREKVREYVEETLADMLGGPLDEITVGQLYKNRDYLPISGSQNDYEGVSHVKLKRLIEKIIEDVLHLPAIIDHSGVPGRSEENLPPYFDPKKYQELLATAVLNKIVDAYNYEKKFNTTEKASTSDLDKNHNTVTSKTEQDYSSSSSVEPHSDSSLTDAINLNRRSLLLSPGDSCDNLIPNIIDDDELLLADYLTNHQVPLPDLSVESESASEDFISIATSNGVEGSWEDNWLFKRKKHGNESPAPIGMLVPAPKEDIRAFIGDKTADEVSDLSEAGSDFEGEDCDMDDLNDTISSPNERVLNKHVIGGKSTVGIFDELLEQTSLISISSLQDNEPQYCETKNDFVLGDDGLNDIEHPNMNLRTGSIPIENEAVNSMITVHILQNSPPKNILETIPTEIFEESILEPPVEFVDHLNSSTCKAENQSEYKMEIDSLSEQLEFNSPVTESNGAQIFTCGEQMLTTTTTTTTNNIHKLTLEPNSNNQSEEAFSFSNINLTEFDISISNSESGTTPYHTPTNTPPEENVKYSQEELKKSRRSSAIEFLAVVALGPVLALSTPEANNTILMVTEENPLHCQNDKILQPTTETIEEVTVVQNLIKSAERMKLLEKQCSYNDSSAFYDAETASNVTTTTASTEESKQNFSEHIPIDNQEEFIDRNRINKETVPEVVGEVYSTEKSTDTLLVSESSDDITEQNKMEIELVSLKSAANGNPIEVENCSGQEEKYITEKQFVEPNSSNNASGENSTKLEKEIEKYTETIRELNAIITETPSIFLTEERNLDVDPLPSQALTETSVKKNDASNEGSTTKLEEAFNNEKTTEESYSYATELHNSTKEEKSTEITIKTTEMQNDAIKTETTSNRITEKAEVEIEPHALQLITDAQAKPINISEEDTLANQEELNYKGSNESQDTKENSSTFDEATDEFVETADLQSHVITEAASNSIHEENKVNAEPDSLESIVDDSVNHINTTGEALANKRMVIIGKENEEAECAPKDDEDNSTKAVKATDKPTETGRAENIAIYDIPCNTITEESKKSFPSVPIAHKFHNEMYISEGGLPPKQEEEATDRDEKFNFQISILEENTKHVVETIEKTTEPTEGHIFVIIETPPKSIAEQTNNNEEPLPAKPIANTSTNNKQNLSENLSTKRDGSIDKENNIEEYSHTKMDVNVQTSAVTAVPFNAITDETAVGIEPLSSEHSVETSINQIDALDKSLTTKQEESINKKSNIEECSPNTAELNNTTKLVGSTEQTAEVQDIAITEHNSHLIVEASKVDSSHLPSEPIAETSKSQSDVLEENLPKQKEESISNEDTINEDLPTVALSKILTKTQEDIDNSIKATDTQNMSIAAAISNPMDDKTTVNVEHLPPETIAETAAEQINILEGKPQTEQEESIANQITFEAVNTTSDQNPPEAEKVTETSNHPTEVQIDLIIGSTNNTEPIAETLLNKNDMLDEGLPTKQEKSIENECSIKDDSSNRVLEENTSMKVGTENSSKIPEQQKSDITEPHSNSIVEESTVDVEPLRSQYTVKTSANQIGLLEPSLSASEEISINHDSSTTEYHSVTTKEDTEKSIQPTELQNVVSIEGISMKVDVEPLLLKSTVETLSNQIDLSEESLPIKQEESIKNESNIEGISQPQENSVKFVESEKSNKTEEVQKDTAAISIPTTEDSKMEVEPLRSEIFSEISTNKIDIPKEDIPIKQEDIPTKQEDFSTKQEESIKMENVTEGLSSKAALAEKLSTNVEQPTEKLLKIEEVGNTVFTDAPIHPTVEIIKIDVERIPIQPTVEKSIDQNCDIVVKYLDIEREDNSPKVEEHTEKSIKITEIQNTVITEETNAVVESLLSEPINESDRESNIKGNSTKVVDNTPSLELQSCTITEIASCHIVEESKANIEQLSSKPIAETSTKQINISEDGCPSKQEISIDNQCYTEEKRCQAVQENISTEIRETIEMTMKKSVAENAVIPEATSNPTVNNRQVDVDKLSSKLIKETSSNHINNLDEDPSTKLEGSIDKKSYFEVNSPSAAQEDNRTELHILAGEKKQHIELHSTKPLVETSEIMVDILEDGYPIKIEESVEKASNIEDNSSKAAQEDNSKEVEGSTKITVKVRVTQNAAITEATSNSTVDNIQVDVDPLSSELIAEISSNQTDISDEDFSTKQNESIDKKSNIEAQSPSVTKEDSPTEDGTPIKIKSTTKEDNSIKMEKIAEMADKTIATQNAAITEAASNPIIDSSHVDVEPLPSEPIEEHSLNQVYIPEENLPTKQEESIDKVNYIEESIPNVKQENISMKLEEALEMSIITTTVENVVAASNLINKGSKVDVESIPSEPEAENLANKIDITERVLSTHKEKLTDKKSINEGISSNTLQENHTTIMDDGTEKTKETTELQNDGIIETISNDMYQENKVDLEPHLSESIGETPVNQDTVSEDGLKPKQEETIHNEIKIEEIFPESAPEETPTALYPNAEAEKCSDITQTSENKVQILERLPMKEQTPIEEVSNSEHNFTDVTQEHTEVHNSVCTESDFNPIVEESKVDIKSLPSEHIAEAFTNKVDVSEDDQPNKQEESATKEIYIDGNTSTSTSDLQFIQNMTTTEPPSDDIAKEINLSIEPHPSESIAGNSQNKFEISTEDLLTKDVESINMESKIEEHPPNPAQDERPTRIEESTEELNVAAEIQNTLVIRPPSDAIVQEIKSKPIAEISENKIQILGEKLTMKEEAPIKEADKFTGVMQENTEVHNAVSMESDSNPIVEESKVDIKSLPSEHIAEALTNQDDVAEDGQPNKQEESTIKEIYIDGDTSNPATDVEFVQNKTTTEPSSNDIAKEIKLNIEPHLSESIAGNSQNKIEISTEDLLTKEAESIKMESNIEGYPPNPAQDERPTIIEESTEESNVAAEIQNTLVITPPFDVIAQEIKSKPIADISENKIEILEERLPMKEKAPIEEADKFEHKFTGIMQENTEVHNAVSTESDSNPIVEENKVDIKSLPSEHIAEALTKQIGVSKDGQPNKQEESSTKEIYIDGNTSNPATDVEFIQNNTTTKPTSDDIAKEIKLSIEPHPSESIAGNSQNKIDISTEGLLIKEEKSTDMESNIEGQSPNRAQVYRPTIVEDGSEDSNEAAEIKNIAFIRPSSDAIVQEIKSEPLAETSDNKAQILEKALSIEEQAPIAIAASKCINGESKVHVVLSSSEPITETSVNQLDGSEKGFSTKQELSIDKESNIEKTSLNLLQKENPPAVGECSKKSSEATENQKTEPFSDVIAEENVLDVEPHLPDPTAGVSEANIILEEDYLAKEKESKEMTSIIDGSSPNNIRENILTEMEKTTEMYSKTTETQRAAITEAVSSSVTQGIGSVLSEVIEETSDNQMNISVDAILTNEGELMGKASKTEVSSPDATQEHPTTKVEESTTEIAVMTEVAGNPIVEEVKVVTESLQSETIVDNSANCIDISKQVLSDEEDESIYKESKIEGNSSSPSQEKIQATAQECIEKYTEFAKVENVVITNPNCDDIAVKNKVDIELNPKEPIEKTLQNKVNISEQDLLTNKEESIENMSNIEEGSFNVTQDGNSKIVEKATEIFTTITTVENAVVAEVSSNLNGQERKLDIEPLLSETIAETSTHQIHISEAGVFAQHKESIDKKNNIEAKSLHPEAIAPENKVDIHSSGPLSESSESKIDISKENLTTEKEDAICKDEHSANPAQEHNLTKVENCTEKPNETTQILNAVITELSLNDITQKVKTDIEPRSLIPLGETSENISDKDFPTKQNELIDNASNIEENSPNATEEDNTNKVDETRVMDVEARVEPNVAISKATGNPIVEKTNMVIECFHSEPIIENSADNVDISKEGLPTEQTESSEKKSNIEGSSPKTLEDHSNKLEQGTENSNFHSSEPLAETSENEVGILEEGLLIKKEESIEKARIIEGNSSNPSQECERTTIEEGTLKTNETTVFQTAIITEPPTHDFAQKITVGIEPDSSNSLPSLPETSENKIDVLEKSPLTKKEESIEKTNNIERNSPNSSQENHTYEKTVIQNAVIFEISPDDTAQKIKVAIEPNSSNQIAETSETGENKVDKSEESLQTKQEKSIHKSSHIEESLPNDSEENNLIKVVETTVMAIKTTVAQNEIITEAAGNHTDDCKVGVVTLQTGPIAETLENNVDIEGFPTNNEESIKKTSNIEGNSPNATEEVAVETTEAQNTVSTESYNSPLVEEIKEGTESLQSEPTADISANYIDFPKEGFPTGQVESIDNGNNIEGFPPNPSEDNYPTEMEHGTEKSNENLLIQTAVITEPSSHSIAQENKEGKESQSSKHLAEATENTKNKVDISEEGLLTKQEESIDKACNIEGDSDEATQKGNRTKIEKTTKNDIKLTVLHNAVITEAAANTIVENNVDLQFEPKAKSSANKVDISEEGLPTNAEESAETASNIEPNLSQQDSPSRVEHRTEESNETLVLQNVVIIEPPPQDIAQENNVGIELDSSNPITQCSENKINISEGVLPTKGEESIGRSTNATLEDNKTIVEKTSKMTVKTKISRQAAITEAVGYAITEESKVDIETIRSGSVAEFLYNQEGHLSTKQEVSIDKKGKEENCTNSAEESNLTNMKERTEKSDESTEVQNCDITERGSQEKTVTIESHHSGPIVETLEKQVDILEKYLPADYEESINKESNIEGISSKKEDSIKLMEATEKSSKTTEVECTSENNIHVEPIIITSGRKASSSGEDILIEQEEKVNIGSNIKGTVITAAPSNFIVRDRKVEHIAGMTEDHINIMEKYEPLTQVEAIDRENSIGGKAPCGLQVENSKTIEETIDKSSEHNDMQNAIITEMTSNSMHEVNKVDILSVLSEPSTNKIGIAEEHLPTNQNDVITQASSNVIAEKEKVGEEPFQLENIADTAENNIDDSEEVLTSSQTEKSIGSCSNIESNPSSSTQKINPKVEIAIEQSIENTEDDNISIIEGSTNAITEENVLNINSYQNKNEETFNTEEIVAENTPKAAQVGNFTEVEIAIEESVEATEELFKSVDESSLNVSSQKYEVDVELPMSYNLTTENLISKESCTAKMEESIGKEESLVEGNSPEVIEIKLNHVTKDIEGSVSALREQLADSNNGTADDNTKEGKIIEEYFQAKRAPSNSTPPHIVAGAECLTKLSKNETEVISEGASLESNTTDESISTIVDLSDKHQTENAKTEQEQLISVNQSQISDSTNQIDNRIVSPHINNINATQNTTIINAPTNEISDIMKQEIITKSLLEDDDLHRPLKHLIPGSIAEREHKKWYNAVEMPNNPYAPDALIRRLSDGPEKPMDIPCISPVLDKATSDEKNNNLQDSDKEALSVGLESEKMDYTRYSRDYYINDSKHASGTRKNNLKPLEMMTSPQNEDSENEPNHQSPSQPYFKISENSEDKRTDNFGDIFLATPVRVEESDPILNKATKLEYLSTPERDFYLLPSEEAVNLKRSSTPSDQNSSQTTNSLTTSEDSDTIRIYDLNKQETRIIKDETIKTPPATPCRARPTVLSLTPKTLAPVAKVVTPTALRFLQPKRKLFDPIMTDSIDKSFTVMDADTIQDQTPTNGLSEKPVIEQEVASSLPSVKALAKAFLLASSKASSISVNKPKSSSWQSLDLKSEPITLTEEECIQPKSPDGPSSDSYSPPYQQRFCPIPSPNMSVIVETDDHNTESNITLETEISTTVERPISPVVKPGQLRSSIAFFENLKKK